MKEITYGDHVSYRAQIMDLRERLEQAEVDMERKVDSELRARLESAEERAKVLENPVCPSCGYSGHMDYPADQEVVTMPDGIPSIRRDADAHESRIEDVAEKMANDTYGMAEKFVAAEERVKQVEAMFATVTSNTERGLAERVKVLTEALRDLAHGDGNVWKRPEVQAALSADQGSEDEESGWYVLDAHVRRALGYLGASLVEQGLLPVDFEQPRLLDLWGKLSRQR